MRLVPNCHLPCGMSDEKDPMELLNHPARYNVLFRSVHCLLCVRRMGPFCFPWVIVLVFRAPAWTLSLPALP